MMDLLGTHDIMMILDEGGMIEMQAYSSGFAKVYDSRWYGFAREYVNVGRAAFIQADATNFSLSESFGLVVSTFDALNHLADEQGLMKCFQRVFDVASSSSI